MTSGFISTTAAASRTEVTAAGIPRSLPPLVARLRIVFSSQKLRHRFHIPQTCNEQTLLATIPRTVDMLGDGTIDQCLIEGKDPLRFFQRVRFRLSHLILRTTRMGGHEYCRFRRQNQIGFHQDMILGWASDPLTRVLGCSGQRHAAVVIFVSTLLCYSSDATPFESVKPLQITPSPRLCRCRHRLR